MLSLANFTSKDNEFVYDGIELAAVYGLYVTVCDLQNADSNWGMGKTNEQHIDDLKQNIKKELVLWMKNNTS